MKDGAVLWDGSAWQVVEDHRGETVYSIETGAVVTIADPGALPDGVTTEPPDNYQVWDADAGTWVTDADALAAAVRGERDARIQAVGWRMERHASETRQGLTPTDDIATLDAYVQALRDIPAHPGFPETVNWPEQPAQEA